MSVLAQILIMLLINYALNRYFQQKLDDIKYDPDTFKTPELLAANANK